MVTTFTDPAAEELRERLRGKVLWALRLVEQKDQENATLPDDHAWLLARWSDASSRHTDRARLKLALAELDAVPVSTLRGLCRRILSDHPFACGLPFSPGDLVAQAMLLNEVVDDLCGLIAQGGGRRATVALAEGLLSGPLLKGVLVAHKNDPELHAVAAFSSGCSNFMEDLAYLPQRRFWRRMAVEARRMLRTVRSCANG